MSFKRFYAFEAEGVSDEVKTQLEAVEKTADEKCTTPEACDKVLNKIETQTEKFNDALSAMAGAAKDCKDGKCSSDDMVVRITPAQAELKEVAKTIGVASEADGVTEEELKDCKDYLEGAKEIVEAKKDELGSGGSDEKKDDDNDEGCDGGDKAEEADVTIDDIIAVEAFGVTADEADYALEAYMDALDDIGSGAITMAAMEGANIDALNTLRTYLKEAKSTKSEMKAAAKAKDYKTAAAKAKEVAAMAKKMEASLNSIPPSVGSTVLTTIALAMIALTAAGVTGKLVGTGAAKIKGTKMYGNAAKKDASARAGMSINAGVAKDKVVNSKVGQAAAGVKASLTNTGNKIAGSKVGTAVGGAKNAVGGAVKKVTDSKAVAKGKEIAGTAKDLGGAVVSGGAIGGAVSVETGTFLRALVKAKAVDADGNPTGEKLNANDFNAVIAVMKGVSEAIYARYTKLASQYEKMASSGETATEAEIVDMFFTDEPAVETEIEGSSFDSFVDACESLMIGGGSVSSGDAAPFLFGE